MDVRDFRWTIEHLNRQLQEAQRTIGSQMTQMNTLREEKTRLERQVQGIPQLEEKVNGLCDEVRTHRQETRRLTSIVSGTEDSYLRRVVLQSVQGSTLNPSARPFSLRYDPPTIGNVVNDLNTPKNMEREVVSRPEQGLDSVAPEDKTMAKQDVAKQEREVLSHPEQGIGSTATKPTTFAGILANSGTSNPSPTDAGTEKKATTEATPKPREKGNGVGRGADVPKSDPQQPPKSKLSSSPAPAPPLNRADSHIGSSEASTKDKSARHSKPKSPVKGTTQKHPGIPDAGNHEWKVEKRALSKTAFPRQKMLRLYAAQKREREVELGDFPFREATASQRKKSELAVQEDGRETEEHGKA